MDNEKNTMEQKVEATVDEIQAIMNRMNKTTFGATTSMEWEGSIQNAPREHENK